MAYYRQYDSRIFYYAIFIENLLQRIFDESLYRVKRHLLTNLTPGNSLTLCFLFFLLLLIYCFPGIYTNTLPINITPMWCLLPFFQYTAFIILILVFVNSTSLTVLNVVRHFCCCRCETAVQQWSQSCRPSNMRNNFMGKYESNFVYRKRKDMAPHGLWDMNVLIKKLKTYPHRRKLGIICNLIYELSHPCRYMLECVYENVNSVQLTLLQK